eukprot:gene14699-19750_t
MSGAVYLSLSASFLVFVSTLTIYIGSNLSVRNSKLFIPENEDNNELDSSELTTGCSLSILFITSVKFPSLKVAALALLMLVIYDIYWVFCSEYFFQKNVMVEVAMKKASNPINDIGNQLNLPHVLNIQSTIELPIKLMVPVIGRDRMMMLGLGDIALPGALIALALRCDQIIATVNHNNHNSIEKENNIIHNSYNLDEESNQLLLYKHSEDKNKIISTYFFELSLFGYIIGMIGAFVGNNISGHAQPALIYLVPCVLVPFMIQAYRRGLLSDVWKGPTKIEEAS